MEWISLSANSTLDIPNSAAVPLLPWFFFPLPFLFSFSLEDKLSIGPPVKLEGPLCLPPTTIICSFSSINSRSNGIWRSPC